MNQAELIKRILAANPGSVENEVELISDGPNLGEVAGSTFATAVREELSRESFAVQVHEHTDDCDCEVEAHACRGELLDAKSLSGCSCHVFMIDRELRTVTAWWVGDGGDEDDDYLSVPIDDIAELWLSFDADPTWSASFWKVTPEGLCISVYPWAEGALDISNTTHVDARVLRWGDIEAESIAAIRFHAEQLERVAGAARAVDALADTAGPMQIELETGEPF